MDLRIGLVGATGAVGEAFIGLLEDSAWSIKELRPFASDQRQGQTVFLKGSEWPLQTLKSNCFKDLDFVFFSSGDDISREWAPHAVECGAFAIDNSAAFRMSPEHLLVVPEVNGQLVQKTKPQIIANPNCSTIQLVVALKPLLDAFGLEDVRVASYQAVSGAGKAGVSELLNQTQSHLHDQAAARGEVFAHPIAFNCLPHIGTFSDDGFCSEEHKIMRETQKILGCACKVSAFTVRVPVLNAHSEAVWVTLRKDPSQEEVVSVLKKAKGLQLISQDRASDYPHALSANGQHPVYVGRVHKDLANERTWLLWIVADNLLKGAALNGLQIAELF